MWKTPSIILTRDRKMQNNKCTNKPASSVQIYNVEYLGKLICFQKLNPLLHSSDTFDLMWQEQVQDSFQIKISEQGEFCFINYVKLCLYHYSYGWKSVSYGIMYINPFILCFFKIQACKTKLNLRSRQWLGKSLILHYYQ